MKNILKKESKIRVYAADTAVLDDDAVFDAGYRMVSDKRRAKIDRMTLRSARQLSLGAELLLMQCLKEYGIVSYQLDNASHGKPYLTSYVDQKGVLHTEPKLHFNLSHSGERVMCAISDQAVGCDVEKVKDGKLLVAKRFFTSQEYEELCALQSKEQQSQLFFRYWTLKESYMKATGLGLVLSPESFCVNKGNQILGYYFREYDLSDGYCYAVCGQTDCFAETICFWDHLIPE